MVGRRRQAGAGMGVDPHAGALGKVSALDAAGRRPGLAAGVQGFGIDAPLDRAAAHGRRLVGIQAQVGQAAAGGHLQLCGHQVDAGHRLGDGVLHLQPRVGFDEDQRQVGRLRIHQKFKGAQAAVAAVAGHAQRVADQLGPQAGIQAGAGRDFHQFLEAALQRAFTLAQGHGLAAIAQHLHLQVARAGDQALGVHRTVAEGGQRLGSAAGKGLGQGGRVGDQAHAAAATARHGLEHQAAGRVQCTLGREEGLQFIQRGRTGARQQWHAQFSRQGAGAGLVTEQRQLRRRGADEADAGIGAGLGEVGPLAEVAIAGVQRITALLAGNGDQRGDVEVGRRPGGGQRHGGIGQRGVQRAGIVGGEHRHRGGAQVLGGAQDAHRYFAAVGDQQFLERHAAMLSRRLPAGRRLGAWRRVLRCQPRLAARRWWALSSRPPASNMAQVPGSGTGAIA